MSDFKTAMFVNFINRRTGKAIKEIPVMNRLTLNKDIRQLCDSFDFEVSYRLSDKIDLHSHDFVEFYFIFNGERFQVGCGFIEDLTSKTSSTSHRFQANGRDFLGQLFNLNFLVAAPFKQATLLQFAKSCVADAYLPEYLKTKGWTRTVMESGSYQHPLIIPQLTDSKRAPILQSMADEIFNTVYQHREGQMMIYGRAHKNDTYMNDRGKVIVANVANANDIVVNHTLNEFGDRNVTEMTLKESFSKVFSECKVFYTGGENGIDYNHTPSRPIFNSEKKARQIYQPEIRTFQTSTLITTAAESTLFSKMEQYAASILRKSNQNLTQIVIMTPTPFYVTSDGQRIPYEVNQVWTIVSPSHDLNDQMRLVGIGYTQDESSLMVQLLFILRDSLT